MIEAGHSLVDLRGGSGGQASEMQRVRIGLTGLAFVFQLVQLGAVVSRWGEDPNPNMAAEAKVEAEPTEPLAELGVAPGESSASNDSQNKQ